MNSRMYLKKQLPLLKIQWNNLCSIINMPDAIIIAAGRLNRMLRKLVYYNTLRQSNAFWGSKGLGLTYSKITYQ
jgi:hypothetical protein